jgi:hypothetical protein
MELNSNIPEFIKKLEAIKAAVAGGNGIPTIPDFSDAIFAALNTGMGLMKRRIFNKSEDAEGKSLGNYHGNKTRLTKKKFSINAEDPLDASVEKERKKQKRLFNKAVKANPDALYTEYEKFRIGRGRQIERKDLELEGSLRRSIETVTINGAKVVIAITNDEDLKKALNNEKQIGNIRAGLNANTGGAAPAKIFTISEEEFEHVKVEGNRLIGDVIKRIAVL